MTWITNELQSLKDQHRRRSLRVVEQARGSRVTIAGQELVNFSSNDYLGLSHHPRVLEAARQAIEAWGVGASSSRLLSGTSAVHQDLEAALAVFLGREAALVFPSGFMTNLGVVTALVGPGDAVVVDRLCHASLLDGARFSGARLFVYAHRNLSEAEDALASASSYRRRLLITDGLFSMDGDFAPARELAALCERYGAMSLLDDAHAIGVWGEGGRGTFVGKEDTPRFDVIVELSKALGSQGGFAAGSNELIEWLINKARSFIYTTGLSPVSAAAARESLRLIQEESEPRQFLKKNAARLRSGLQSLGFDTCGSESQIVPVRLGAEDRALEVASQLRSEGFYAPAIRPPTVPAGECRLRFSVTAAHPTHEIDRLLAAFSKVLEHV